MKIRLKSLVIQCRESREILDLDHHINVFHGKISAGKSSIVRLINYCFGGSLEKTPAIQKEMISASLLVNINTFEVLLERTKDSKEIQVTWTSNNSTPTSILASTDRKDNPIWSDDIYSFSDLMYHFFDFTPLKVRRSKTQIESPLISLSFRDIMWYCYLDQDRLDSSFFRLEDTFKRLKSRDVMRLLVGFYSQKLNLLEIELEEKTKERLGKLSAVKELSKFLERFGYDSVDKIEKEINELETKYDKSIAKREKLEKGYINETHSSDRLRKKIFNQMKLVQEKEELLFDLTQKIEDQTSLKAELISTKYKLAKTETVDNILSGVKFESCPQCGTGISSRKSSLYQCTLCLSDIEKQKIEIGLKPDSIRLDIDDRVKDLDISIVSHKKAKLKTEAELSTQMQIKNEMDNELHNSLSTYESTVLSGFREIEKEIATYKEKLNSQKRLKLIPVEIENLEEMEKVLSVEILELKQKIQKEKESLIKSETYLNELETTFLEFLLKVDVPGVNKEDKVTINRKTWEVYIYPKGDEDYKWNFFNAGSGGKKTLFNVCYALAIHTVASRFELPLPSFLMIDTPMKNIGEDVNEDLFNNFYTLLYELAEEDLRNTQFIIIDKEFYKSSNKSLDINSRFMTPDNDENPPLIRYYRGA